MIDVTDNDAVYYYYYYYDGLGSVVALSNNNGDVVERYKYDAFGNTTILSADEQTSYSVSQYGNPYMFTGRRYDDETGLYYYRARIYNPAIGRFLQTDPIGYDDGMNMYAYVGNNPINFVDLWGLCKGNSSYLTTSAKQLILGDYTDDVTLLGTAAQLGTGFLGIDLPGDIRDIIQNTTNWERTWGHAGKTALNVVGILPVVGALKYGDEVGTLLKRSRKTTKGIYEFTARSGKPYVGQSGAISTRIGRHLGAGKLDVADLRSLDTTSVSGGRLARRIAEQKRINALRGIKRGNLENKINAVRESDWVKYGIAPPQ